MVLGTYRAHSRDSSKSYDIPNPSQMFSISALKTNTTVIAYFLNCVDSARICSRLWLFQQNYFPCFLTYSCTSIDTPFFKEVSCFPLFAFFFYTTLLTVALLRPLSFVIMATSGLLTTIIAISVDTSFYTPHSITWSDLYRHPVITPWNNIQYNSSSSNLAQHGLHPWYQHLLVNLPLLIGPAIVLLFRRPHLSPRLYSAISGVAVLSIFQHQEARFLLPAIPLLLSSIRLPKKPTHLNAWIAVWVCFNAILALLMGVYHQGGIVPTQVFMSKQPDATRAIWWKTYMPPIWLLNGKNAVLQTTDVAGMAGDELLESLQTIATCDTPADRRNREYLKERNGTYLIAPLSTTWLDPYLDNKGLDGLRFREVWRYSKHLNLDDLDWAEDGFWPTIKRVIGRRGLAAWRVTKSCGPPAR